MHTLPEHLIETFVIDPERLDAAVRREVVDHLFTCRECRRVAQIFAGFYADLLLAPIPRGEVMQKLLEGPTRP